jgi:hypothetical protein
MIIIRHLVVNQINMIKIYIKEIDQHIHLIELLM